MNEIERTIQSIVETLSELFTERDLVLIRNALNVAYKSGQLDELTKRLDKQNGNTQPNTEA